MLRSLCSFYISREGSARHARISFCAVGELYAFDYTGGMHTIIQIGATRDGLDPYKEVAEGKGMQCILIETPEYLELRKHLARKQFSREVAVAEPSDPQQVIAAIEALGLGSKPAAVLAGFERYSFAAYDVAAQLDVRPHRAHAPFRPPTKIEARDRIKDRAVLQPQYLLLTDTVVTPAMIAGMQFPLVVKPIDGGGGLGTFKVGTYAALQDAMERLADIKNYDGADFAGFMIEEAIAGQEFTVQGVVRDGEATIFTVCKKIIFTSPVGENIWIFREAGHIATSGEEAEPALRAWVQTCLESLGYKNGPFMADGIQTDRGAFFLEMNFRLSGFGILKLVTRVTGLDWAEAAFNASLGLPDTPVAAGAGSRSACIGELRARFESELQLAEALAARHNDVTVERLTAAKPTLTSRRLESDLTRLGGTLGKITVDVPTIDQAEKLLLSCLVERAPHLVKAKR
jgi:biotin carboxylase